MFVSIGKRWAGSTGMAGLAGLILGLALSSLAPGAIALGAELVMLEQPGCPWCKRFNEEIAPAYARTEEGKRAPLRRVDITEPWPEDLETIARERLTPTFILMDEGLEIGRLRGYPGDAFFWGLLGEMLAKLPEAPTSGTSVNQGQAQ